MSASKIGRILVVDDEVELKNILVEQHLTGMTLAHVASLIQKKHVAAIFGHELQGVGDDDHCFAFTVEIAQQFHEINLSLAVLRSEAFDVVLTDLMMPGMDGITLVRESLQIDPHVVAIVMTGQGTIQTAVDAMKVGAFDYVLKPFRLQNVLPVLTRAMNTRHMRLENLQLRETVAIYELAHTIAFTLDPQTIINKLADVALQQTDADEVSILLPVNDADELYVAAARGENRQPLLGERVPLDKLKDAMEDWFRRKGYLTKGAGLFLETL